MDKINRMDVTGTESFGGGMDVQVDIEEPQEAPNWEEFMRSPQSYVLSSDLLASMGESETPLARAVRLQSVEAVLRLLELGQDPNQLGVPASDHQQQQQQGPQHSPVSPLACAATKGMIEVIEPLILSGAIVDAAAISSGSSALIQASHFGHYGVVELLLKHRARADFANKKGTTALMRASQEGHTAISTLLINAGADVNRKNNEGMNALMLCSQRGHASMASLLTHAGAVVDEQTAQGSTALMLACKRGNENVVEVLVSMGAEIYIKDGRERTARDTAIRKNHQFLLKWLDTNVQREKMRDYEQSTRLSLFRQIEEAYSKGTLRISNLSQRADMLYERHILKASINGMPTSSVDSTAVSHLVESIRPSYVPLPGSIAPRRPGYANWQWVYLLKRSLALPTGIFGIIMQYIPKPRSWRRLLRATNRRYKLAPHQAIKDTCVIIDEILADANIFPTSDQSQLLVRLSRSSPSYLEHLVTHMDLPAELLNDLVKNADIQSLSSRVRSSSDVNFSINIAKEIFDLGVALYKWQDIRQTPRKIIGTGSSSEMMSSGLGLRPLTGARDMEPDLTCYADGSYLAGPHGGSALVIETASVGNQIIDLDDNSENEEEDDYDDDDGELSGDSQPLVWEAVDVGHDFEL
jgi:ankyrin repeat protein